MRLLKLSDLPKSGKLILIYGETGSGKTTSCFQSLPDPILYFAIEPRNPLPSIEAAEREGLRFHVFQYEGWMDLIEMLSVPERFSKYSSLVFDSISYLMTVLGQEIEDESFDSRSREEQKKKPLISSAKLSMEGFGGLASQMARFTKLAGKISETGKIVVCTALLQENPKWDRELSAAPVLKGREYPTIMPAYFDLIGLVRARHNAEGRAIYPPSVSFEGEEGYLAKWTGKKTGRKIGPLDFRRILDGGSEGIKDKASSVASKTEALIE